MARFKYEARDANNQLASGTLQALDRSAALQVLARRYPLVTDLEEVKPARRWLQWLMPAGLTQQNLLGLFQQLSVSTRAGVSLKGALETMSYDCESAPLHELLTHLGALLNEGRPLSAAMAETNVFEKYQCSLVKAGEASGRLPETLRQLAEEMEGRDMLANQVRTAVAYPIFVMGVALILSAVLLAWGVPQVQTIYQSMGVVLPLPTRVLIFVGGSLTSAWPLWLGLALLARWAFAKVWRNPDSRARLQDTVCGLYPIRESYLLLNVAFFSRTLGLLYSSGLPLNQALSITGDAASSPRLRRALLQVAERLNYGEVFSSALRRTGYFPSMALEMIGVGEVSGELDTMLSELDRYYTRRCELAIKSLTSLIEPMLTVLVGLMLACIILGLGLPFLNLSSAFM